MEILATDTEQLIKDTAKKVFFVDGNIHATTQDIADAAGINRASIHYYYRSRKQLFDKVFMEALAEMRGKMLLIASAELPLIEKAEKFVDFFFEKSLQHPYLELFVITERNANPLLDISMMTAKDHEEEQKKLADAIDHEVAKGNMKFITPDHFIITIMSLCSFPFLGKPIIQSALHADDSAYFKLISERKKVIMQLLFLNT